MNWTMLYRSRSLSTASAASIEEFAESHIQLQKTVDQAKEQIAEAVKAIEERDKNKVKAKATARPTTAGEDANTDKAGSTNPGLFDAAAVPTNKDDGKADP